MNREGTVVWACEGAPVTLAAGELRLHDSKTGAPPAARLLVELPRIEGSSRVVPGLKPGRHLADLDNNTYTSINVLRVVQSAPSGSPRSSKYFLVTLNTIGASRRRPMRFGTAISPLRVSDRFQTKSTLTLANESAAAIHSTR